MIERDRVSRVRLIRELTACGLLDAKKYELWLWHEQKEINNENLRDLMYRHPSRKLVTPQKEIECCACKSKIAELESRIKQLEDKL